MLSISLGECQVIFALENEESPEEGLLRIFEVIAEVSEHLRKENQAGAVSCIPIIFRDFLTFTNCCGIDLEKAVWEKYPAVCPYCLREERCLCISEGRIYGDSKELEKFREKNKRPNNLEEWQIMFRRIYGNVNSLFWAIVIWLHFVEEIGEISKAFRKKNDQALKEELADAFAWLMAFCDTLNTNLAEIMLTTSQ